MTRITDDEEPSTTSSTKHRYASNATPAILEILWRNTYSGHGLSTRQIHDALTNTLGAEAPAIRTVANQLNALEGKTFLGREIHKLNPKYSEDDAFEMDGVSEPQSGWRMSTFFDPSEARLLTDGLALSRISRDSISGIVAKLNELVGGLSLGNDYLTTTSAKDDFNGEFLRDIGLLNEAITSRRSVTFHYTNYDRTGHLRPRLSKDTGKPREYLIDPYQMVFKNGRYYLIGALHDDAAKQRMFRIDRIIDLRIGDVPCHTMQSDFDAIAYMRERPYPVTDEPVTIVMTVPATAFNPIFEWFDSPEIIGPDRNGLYMVTVRSPIIAAYWWTLQYADIPIIIRRPRELRQRLAKTGRVFEIRYRFAASRNDAHMDNNMHMSKND